MLSVSSHQFGYNKDGSRSGVVHLHARPQELSAHSPVPLLPHTPGLRVRRDTSRAGAFGRTKQEVSGDETDEFVHFRDWSEEATVGRAPVSGETGTRDSRRWLGKGWGMRDQGTVETIQWVTRERNVLGLRLVVVNRMELRNKEVFIALRELEELGDHLAYRPIVHLTVEQDQRLGEREGRHEALLHGRLARFCSTVAEVSACKTGGDETHRLEVLLTWGILVEMNGKGCGYNIQQIFIERVTARAESNFMGDELAVIGSGRAWSDRKSRASGR